MDLCDLEAMESFSQGTLLTLLRMRGLCGGQGGHQLQVEGQSHGHEPRPAAHLLWEEMSLQRLTMRACLTMYQV